MFPPPRCLKARFYEKIWVNFETGCWEWTAVRNGGEGAYGGYGLIWLHGQHRRAHRVAYELLIGPIPEGLYLDHLCRVRHCVNPEHLEPVTNRENQLRGARAMGQRDVCLRGHLRTAENTYTRPNGQRECRMCWRDNSRNAKKQAAAE